MLGWLLAMMPQTSVEAAAPAPAISNVSATRISDGTGCGAGIGVRYRVAWNNNASVTNADHDVKITLGGVGGTVTATQTSPVSITFINITSQENHLDGAATPGTYTCTFELIATAGPTTIQSGNVTGDPSSAIYDIETDCAV